MSALSKPVKREIRLATRDTSAAPPLVRAEVYADTSGVDALALHKCQYGWDITHVRTGYRVTQIIGTKALALQVLGCLIANADWCIGEFSGNSNPVFEAARYALWKAHAIQFPDKPLPPYRTRREQRLDRQLAARLTWERYEAQPEFVTWATPEIDYTGLGRDRTRYAVVRRDPPCSGLGWARLVICASELPQRTDESQGAFHESVVDHREGAVEWATRGARYRATEERERLQAFLIWRNALKAEIAAKKGARDDRRSRI